MVGTSWVGAVIISSSSTFGCASGIWKVPGPGIGLFAQQRPESLPGQCRIPSLLRHKRTLEAVVIIVSCGELEPSNASVQQLENVSCTRSSTYLVATLQK